MNIYEFSGAEIPDDFYNLLKIQEKNDIIIEERVLEIKKKILEKGFDALIEYSKKFDKFDLTGENFQVSESEINTLAAKVDPALSETLEIAVQRVKDFHEKELQESFEFKDEFDNKMGQKITPIDSVAIYVPGGEFVLLSTLYMTAVPAIIAGVRRIVLLSPPRAFMSCELARLIQILGIKECYRIGGAQAIYAAVYGVETLKPVDKIVGPGNDYVSKAKELSFGKIDIDMIAGPSEILVIADTDDENDIPLIAGDLLSQAEHGPAGVNRSIVLGTNKEFLLKIEKETYRQANKLPEQQKNNAIKSLNKKGIIIVCKDRFKAVEFSNLIAPEHLELFSSDPYPLLDRVKNAGSVFVGKYTPESVGDYIGGPNHVLPTCSTARFFSPLGVYDFQKRFSWIEFNKGSLEKFTDHIGLIARSEGLEAHARSAEIRFENIK